MPFALNLLEFLIVKFSELFSRFLYLQRSLTILLHNFVWNDMGILSPAFFDKGIYFDVNKFILLELRLNEWNVSLCF